MSIANLSVNWSRYKKRTKERTNERTNERKKERKKQTNKQTNKQIMNERKKERNDGVNLPTLFCKLHHFRVLKTNTFLTIMKWTILQ